MNSNPVTFYEPGIRALACLNCRSTAELKLDGSYLHCPDCGASYAISDGVLDLMPPDFSGYPGASMEAAVLRDAHNQTRDHHGAPLCADRARL